MFSMKGYWNWIKENYENYKKAVSFILIGIVTGMLVAVLLSDLPTSLLQRLYVVASVASISALIISIHQWRKERDLFALATTVQLGYATFFLEVLEGKGKLTASQIRKLILERTKGHWTPETSQAELDKLEQSRLVRKSEILGGVTAGQYFQITKRGEYLLKLLRGGKHPPISKDDVFKV